jgi:glucan 1,3-beta-glucosidase
MASHVTYDPIGTGGRPQSPETEEIQLHSPLADDQEEDPYAAGFLDPDILPTIRAINQPPDLDVMPVPVSYLPAGAQPPSRFYSALGTVDEPYGRDSFASSAHELSTPPRPGYRDSDYGSISHLRPDSTFGSLATYTPESPRVTSFGTYRDDPSASTANFAMDDIGGASVDKRELYTTPREKRSRQLRALIITCLVLLIAAAIGVSLYFFVFKKKSSQNDTSTTPGSASPGSSGSLTATQSTGGSGSPTSNVIITGGDGSTLLLDGGGTMTYTNKLGGYWYYDQNDPFNGAARAQSYTPPLNQSWQYGVDRIFG